MIMASVFIDSYLSWVAAAAAQHTNCQNEQSCKTQTLRNFRLGTATRQSRTSRFPIRLRSGFPACKITHTHTRTTPIPRHKALLGIPLKNLYTPTTKSRVFAYYSKWNKTAKTWPISGYVCNLSHLGNSLFRRNFTVPWACLSAHPFHNLARPNELDSVTNPT